MSTVIGIVAVVVAVVALVVCIGNLGYLAMLGSAARKRGISGAPVADHTRSKMPLAAGAGVGALVALLLTSGGPVADVFAMVLGTGSALVAKRSLDTTRARFRSNP